LVNYVVDRDANSARSSILSMSPEPHEHMSVYINSREGEKKHHHKTFDGRASSVQKVEDNKIKL
jgi:hypothetical protein